MKRVILAFVAVALAFASGACGITTVPFFCDIPPTPPSMLYPQPGSTGVTGNPLALYFDGDPTEFGSPHLVPSNGGPTVIGGPYEAASPGPLPSGAASPGPGYQVFVSVLPTFAPMTVYTLAFTNGNCGRGFNNRGSFTTR